MENKNNELVAIVEAQGVVMTDAQSLVACFNVHLSEAKKLIEEAKLVTVEDENDVEGMDKARSLRLAIAKVRVASEKDRKAFKEESLKKGKTIDLVAKKVSELIDPVETQLEDMEKLALRKAMEKKEKALKDRLDARTARLQPYLLPNTDIFTVFMLKDMPDSAFETLLEQSKVVFEAHKAKIAKEEAEKAELERLQKEEQERIKSENDKLKKEKEKRDEQDRIEREAREKKEAEEKGIADEKFRVEREAREKAEQELRDKQEAERKEKERIENERKAKEEAERQAQLAPDKEKILAFADSIRGIKMPTGLSDNCQRLVLLIGNQLLLISDELKKEVENL